MRELAVDASAKMHSEITPHNFWQSWNFELLVLLPLVISALIYFWGTRNIWGRAGTARGIRRHHYTSFFGALLALIVAFVSPLDALSEVLFSAHMVQHMILLLIAAPLLVLSEFPLAFVWALPRYSAQGFGSRWNQSPVLSRIWQALRSPILAWVLFTVAFWIWHASSLYEAALQSEVIHSLEHITFLTTAMLFWWVLLKPSRQKHRHYGIAIPYLFTTILQSGILGALMTFSSQPWYPYYSSLVAPWGLTPLQDQQLAGLIMWIPGGAVFTLLTIGYFAAWLHALEERSSRFQREPLRTRQELK